MNKKQDPFFIIGNPRSGTTLLRLVLANHSQIIVPPECGFIVWLLKDYGNWSVEDNTSSGRLDNFINDLAACRKMDTWNLRFKNLKVQILKSRPENYADLCRVVYLAYASGIGKRSTIWGDKNNFHIDHLVEISHLYENARFLHIVRDGRDVACSYREVMHRKTDNPYAPKLETAVSKIALEWSANVTKVESFCSNLSDSKCKTIKYEDLVTDPQIQIFSICDWLGIGFEKDMVRFYQKGKQKILEPLQTLEWKQRTLTPISNLTVGRYAKLLTNDELSTFNGNASTALRRFNYL